jgi:Icc-related predicted phosphoesterase
VKILSVSDVEIGFIYSPRVVDRFRDVDLIVSCGDISYYYLEYIVSMLDVPMYYVLGNHANQVEDGVGGPRDEPWGATNLHNLILHRNGLILAGLQGCLRYNEGPFQYTQEEMWRRVIGLGARLLLNRVGRGRYLDVFISHAPPWGIHDMPDRPHQGFRAFRWLIGAFHPAVHLHGHIHVYNPSTVVETLIGTTRVINTYGYRVTSLEPQARPVARGTTKTHPQ